MSTPSHIEKVETKFNLLPFGSNVAAPNITKEDVSVFLRQSTGRFNHYIDQKFLEIRSEMEELLNLYQLNEEIYSSELRFEPVVGYTYHLYTKKDGSKFLSLIAPNEWNMPYICSVTLNTEGRWVLQSGTYPKE